jgi:hypothetical protein
MALKDRGLSLPEHGKIVRAWLSHFLLTAAKNTEITMRSIFSSKEEQASENSRVLTV